MEGSKNPMELREVEDWVVEPRFLQVPGVTDVTPFGGLIKQYQIEIDPNALAKFNLSISQIAQAVTANNGNAGGALLDNKQQSMVIRGVGLIQNTEDIENIVVNETKGVPVFVRDMGRVNIGAAPQTGIFGVNDETGGVEGIVLMRRGENPSEVLDGIKEAVEDLNTNRLPKGVQLVPIYDRTDLVHNTLHTVSHTLLEGLIVVVAVLFLFLGSVRAALLTAITNPLSLLFAFVCMHFTGIPANLLSLGALDFGIIVDGTLVMVEHIVHTSQAARASAEARTHRLALSRRGSRSGVADLLLAAHHHFRLHPAVHAGARRTAAVHAHGVYGVLRAAWLDAARADADSRFGDLPVPARLEGLAKPGASLAPAAI